MMAGKDGRSCPYRECFLPENNNKYWVQLAYLCVSMLFLISNEKEFTFFSLLMFTAPILLDLTSTTIDGILFKWIFWIFSAMNAVIAVFCVSGMFGVFEDAGSAFVVTGTSMLFPEMSIDKRLFLVPLILNVCIPVMMVFACPTKSSKKVVNRVREERKAGSV